MNCRLYNGLLIINYNVWEGVINYKSNEKYGNFEIINFG